MIVKTRTGYRVFLDDALGFELASLELKSGAVKIDQMSGEFYAVCPECKPSLVYHHFLDGAPDLWAKTHGATHTLLVQGDLLRGRDGRQFGSGTRPAKIRKTVAYIGIDETEDGDILWEKWQITKLRRFPE